MARITIRTATGTDGDQALFAGPDDPIHLSMVTLSPGERRVIDAANEGAAHVWKGGVEAEGLALPAGSSVILEAGARQEIVAGKDRASLLLFRTALPDEPRASKARAHLLPTGQVPRYAPEPGAGGAAGGLHADGQCAGCAVWLHENRLPPVSGDAPALLAMAERGVHSHSEDEIIVVTHGAMRLGQRLFGPGTAIAIARDTMYSFTPGPEGLAFVNYRPGPPQAFRMKSGGTFDEAGYWRERVSPPVYAPA